MKNVRCEMFGKKMKRILVLFLILDLFMMTSCKKCIKEEKLYDAVLITDVIYVPQRMQPYYINGKIYFYIYPAEYKTIVEYKRKQYELFDYQAYNLCKDNGGKMIQAEITKKTYDDGSIKYFVIKLKGA